MQFNPGNSQGIVDDIDFLIGTNSTRYPIAQKTRNINRWMDRAVYLVFTADGTWQWDDQNQTDLPIGLTSLVEDQQDYAINSAHLRITRVEIKDADGNWVQLKPIDQHQVQNQSLTDFKKEAGTPAYYDKIANSIFLYPKPSYTQASSLKVYFQRGAVAFTVSDTTEEPGIASIFHRYPSLGASYDYAVSKGLKQAGTLRAEIANMETSMVDFYAKRSKDAQTRLSPRRIIAR
jgi:hypothetical protein